MFLLFFAFGRRGSILPHIRSFSHLTALHIAAQNGSLEIARRLITAGADVNAADYEGSCPLQLAATMDHDKVVKLLLEHGANADHQDADGRTALHYAAMKSGMNAALVLLLHGASQDILDRNDYPPEKMAELANAKDAYEQAVSQYHAHQLKQVYVKEKKRRGSSPGPRPA